MNETGGAVSSSPRLKVDLAYQQLRRMIVTLELAPGSYIDEKELMVQLDIGRTPLREAVMRLVAERLVVHTPRKGAWISTLSITDLQQMLEARTAIDAIIARRAAERITDEDRAQLWGFLDYAAGRLEARYNVELVELDFELHRYVAKIADNTYLAGFWEQINSAMLRYWHLASRNAQTLPSWAGRHHSLVEAITSGDADWAEAQARQHVKHLRDNLRNVLM